MTVVVMGATGSVGTALLARLVGEVVGVARRLPDETAHPYSRARWMRCDLAAPDAVFGGRRLRVPLPVLRTLAWLTWRVGLQPMRPGWLRLADEVPLVDTSRARLLLDWRPEHDTRGALEEFVTAVACGRGAPSAPLVPRAEAGSGRLGRGVPTHQSQGGGTQ